LINGNDADQRGSRTDVSGAGGHEPLSRGAAPIWNALRIQRRSPSTRLITTLVIKELTREYSASLPAETIKACARAAIRDLRGSISPEAMPERLAKVRLAAGPASVQTPGTVETAYAADTAQF
jgi:hypothetical protein